MQRPFLFLLVLFFATSTSALDRDVHNLNGYQHLTRKLGDDSYLVRERAEQKLLRLGLDAFVELQQAKEDADAEIARRAEGILSRLEQLSVGRENEAVRYWVTAYSLQSDPVEKGAIIWLLCNPLSDFRAGEGLSTLCRIARFDENRALRAEAVKALIASPPVAQKMQRKWYRSIRDTIHDPGDDELLQLLSLFVELRCIFDERREEVDASLQKRVLDLTDRMAEFQTDPKNNGIRAGNRNDILLFYALAMLQDRAGLAAERDRAVAAAAMVQTEEPTKTTDGDTIELGASKPFYDHLHVSRILRSQYRLAWAKQHFDLVIGHGDILFKIDACHLAAEASLFQKKFAAAVSYFDKAAELAGSEPFKARQSNSAELVKRFQVGRFLVLAHQAAAENDWQKVEEHVVAGLILSSAVLSSHAKMLLMTFGATLVV